jgi:DNA-binding NtrC family response regulator
MSTTLPAPVAFHESDLAGKRLLVVKNDEAILLAVSRVLRHAGATVRSARGMMAAADADFDAVLTDLRMQGESGKSILSMIKSVHPDMPVLIMSAFWTKEIKEECAQLGATNLLDKPLRSWHLLGSVSRTRMGAARVGR